MPKGSSYDDLAREAALRIDRAAAVGQQLSLLPEAEPGAEAQAESGRVARGKGKATSQLRDFLAAQGARMPEAVLAEIGGLTGRGDVFEQAMRRTEQILAWAGEPTPGKRLATFQMVYAGMIRASEALLPYGLAKVTPDVAVTAVIPVMQVPAGPSRPGDGARDVTPGPRRMAPPPLPGEIQQNQGLGQSTAARSDGGFRTDGASD